MPVQRAPLAAPLTAPRFRLTCCSPQTFNRLLGLFFCGFRLSSRTVMVALIALGAFSMATIVGVYFSIVHRALFSTTGALLVMTPVTLYLALGAGYLWVRSIFSDPGYAQSSEGERVRGFAADFVLNTAERAATPAAAHGASVPARVEEGGVNGAGGGGGKSFDVAPRAAPAEPEPFNIRGISDDYVAYTEGRLSAHEFFERHRGSVGGSYDEFEQRLKRFCNVCKINRDLDYHHCRVCRRCVLAQDHHCPFIGNCVGKRNRGLFLVTLFYIALGGLYSALACAAYMHRLGYADYGLRASMQLGLNTQVVFGALRALRSAGMFAAWSRPLVMTSLVLSAVWTFWFGLLFFWNAYLAALGVTQLHLLTLMSVYSWRQLLRRGVRDFSLANLRAHLSPHGLRPGALLWYRW